MLVNWGLMGFNQQNGGFNGIYPLVIEQCAIENASLTVDLPIPNGDFPVRYVSLPEGNRDNFPETHGIRIGYQLAMMVTLSGPPSYDLVEIHCEYYTT